MRAVREPWDRMEDENGDAYTRFLIYRNIGLNRSLMRAYHIYLTTQDGFTGGTERLHVPGSWKADSSHYDWKSRCLAWDIRNLHAYGARMAVLSTQANTMVAKKCVRMAKQLKPGDEAWPDLLESLRVVAEYLSPEVVRGIQEKYQPARIVVPVVSDGDDSGDDGVG